MAKKIASPDYFITDGITTYNFPSAFDRRIASWFFDKKSNLMFALSVDFPGLYEIPLCYEKAVWEEMKRLGFKWGYAKRYSDPTPRVARFFLGRRRGSRYSRPGSTNRADARSFKLYFLKTEGLIPLD